MRAMIPDESQVCEAYSYLVGREPNDAGAVGKDVVLCRRRTAALINLFARYGLDPAGWEVRAFRGAGGRIRLKWYRNGEAIKGLYTITGLASIVRAMLENPGAAVTNQWLERRLRARENIRRAMRRMYAGSSGTPRDAPAPPDPHPDAPEPPDPRPDAPEPTDPRPDAPEPRVSRPDAPEPPDPRPDAPAPLVSRPDAPALPESPEALGGGEEAPGGGAPDTPAPPNSPRARNALRSVLFGCFVRRLTDLNNDFVRTACWLSSNEESRTAELESANDRLRKDNARLRKDNARLQKRYGGLKRKYDAVRDALNEPMTTDSDTESDLEPDEEAAA